MFTYFDVEKVVKSTGINAADFDRLAKAVRQEFPDDEMMFELHLMRAIKAESKTDSLQASTMAYKASLSRR
ncbi:hypothetical protein SDD30_16025 [Moorella naiadis]|uniref:hypothetical protein n=1 Tax=Moorella naiadis (nom. illeg.) TaxID=3093670 RepID=UPI003D9CB826